MYLKRKRSESELSTSTTSTFDSPPRFGFAPPTTDVCMDTGNFIFVAESPASPLSRFGNNKNISFPRVSGRTMKRFRDSRPSEEDVHQRTLNILYAAQKQQAPTQSHGTHAVHQRPHHLPTAAQPGPSSSSFPSSQQPDLHSFWNLPSRPSAPQVACMPPTSIETPTDCEDCGQMLCSDDGMMDVDDASGMGGTSCGACGKHVCSHCSITNLGEQRRCLGCAGPAQRTRGSMRNASTWATGLANWLC